jgi:hypothetical protein
MFILSVVWHLAESFSVTSLKRVAYDWVYILGQKLEPSGLSPHAQGVSKVKAVEGTWYWQVSRGELHR